MKTIYKYLILLLITAIGVLGGFYYVERQAHNATQQQLTKKIASLQGIIQETNTVVSLRGVEIENLKAKNKDLQEIIEDRNEEIVALTKANVRLKDKVFKLKKANESLLDESGEPADLSEECEECLVGKRFRVDFDHEDDLYHVSGYTLTNPAYAEVNLKWLRSLQLDLVLSKNKYGDFRVYVDSEDVVPTDLTLHVDPKVFAQSWYEKIAIDSHAAFGRYSGQVSVGVKYDLTRSWSAGGIFVQSYNGRNSHPLYGVGATWRPFRK
jgi:hypothetical protein